MSEPSPPNVIDYLTLAAAVIAPIAAAWTTIWSVRRAESEKFNLHIDWKDFLEENYDYNQIPFLYVQNLTDQSLIIASIQWYRGAFRRRMTRDTALPWEDPFDLNFPYTIDAGSVRDFALDEHVAAKHFSKAKRISRSFGLFKRSAIWIGVTTVSGKTQFIGGERVLPWDERPRWIKVTDDD